MPSGRGQAERVARAAARRLLLADAVVRLGRAVAWGAGAGLLLIFAARGAGIAAPGALLVLAPILVAASAALVAASINRASLLGGALALDRAAGLKERVSAAVALAAAGDPGVFAALARSEGDAAAAAADPRRVAPVRFGSAWWVAGAALAACWAAALWMPPLLIGPRGPEGPEPAAERELARRDVSTAAEAVQAALPLEEAREDPRVAAQIEALEAVERELAQGSVAPEEARARSAGALQEISRQVERRAEERQAVADALRQRLSQAARRAAESGAGAPSPALDPELTEALASGDLERAAKLIESGLDRADEMDPEARRRLADQLRALGSALDEPTGSPPSAPAASDPSPLAEQLAGQGVASDEADRLLDTGGPEALARELERSGLPPDAARDLADRADRERLLERAEQDARDAAREMSRQLQDTAERLEHPPPPPSAPTPPDADAPPGGPDVPQPPATPDPPASDAPDPATPSDTDRRPPPTGDRPSDAGAEPRQGTRQPGSRRTGADTQPGSSGEQRTGDTRPVQDRDSQPGTGQSREGQSPSGDQPAPSDASGSERQPRPAPDQDSRTPNASPARPGTDGQPSDAGQRDRAAGESTDPREQPRSGGEQPEPDGTPPAGDGLPTPGETGTDAPSDQPDPAREPGSAPGTRDIAEQFRRLARAPSDAARDRRASEDLRRRAEELLRGMNESERRELERLARQWGEQGLPGDAGAGEGGREPGQGPASPEHTGPTEDVDARRDEPAPGRERVVAEWYRPGGPGEEPGADPAAAWRQAARAAARAAEQQGVPARHADLIRRVSRRYAERTPPPAAESGPDRRE